MKKPKRKMSPGASRARRPRTGRNKGMLILLSDDEKMNIENAAEKMGISMSRFIVERALHSARRNTGRSRIDCANRKKRPSRIS